MCHWSAETLFDRCQLHDHNMAVQQVSVAFHFQSHERRGRLYVRTTVRKDGRRDGQFYHNQNFLDA